MNEFIQAPRIGEVYNLGGGRDNSTSILEAFPLISEISGKRMSYISDLSRMKAHYPNWDLTRNLHATFEESYQAWQERK